MRVQPLEQQHLLSKSAVDSRRDIQNSIPRIRLRAWQDSWFTGVWYRNRADWIFLQFDVTDAGMLTTASDLAFTGGREGYFYALDAKTGKELWKANFGGSIVMAPIIYRIDGQQYVSVISGHTLVTFALRN